MKPLYLPILVLTFFIVNCTRTVPASSSSGYEEIALQQLGEDAQCEPSEAGTFMLCKKITSPSSLPQKSWKYFVYDNTNRTVVLEDDVDKGSVKWYSNHEVVEVRVPGTMAEGQTMDDYSWIIDVVSGKKTRKSEYILKEDH